MKLVGCSVFRTEFEHAMGTDTTVDWLPAGLHVREGRLAEEIAAALEGTSGAACVCLTAPAPATRRSTR